MLGVPHCHATKIMARSRTARIARIARTGGTAGTARTARTALALGLCTAALTLSAGTASASGRVAPPAGAVSACQPAADSLAAPAADSLTAPVSGEAVALCKLVNGWD
ncbi:hypothetical protein [Streptomyces sp. NPDC058653]|uniref:hypothetical protein n=1 Tax=Streptomyces sp. NPDC058653 TaxID=3346576 RepID=UPI0036581CAC